MFFNKVLEKKKIVLIILAIFLVLGIITGIICKKEKYIASSTILLKSNDPQYSLTTSKYNTYKQIIKNDETLNKIENQTGIVINYRELAKSIGISREADSNTMNIIIKREKQDEAVILLNSLINNFSKKIPEIYEDEEVVVLDHSHIIEKVSNVNFILIIPLSIVCSAIVSVAYIYTHILIENKKKAKKEIEENTLTKPLISIPLNKTKSKLLISAENEKYLRPFDNLKTTIQFINFNKESKKSILITSLFDCEGKSYIAANLAISYALAGKRVVLIDADMDSGTQSKLFDVPNNLGFSNYLSSLNENGIESEELINKYINETSVNNLNLITSGTIPPNSQELLYGDKIETLVKDLSTFFDIIIIDGRSIANRVDSLVLTRFVDSTLIIATPKNAKTEELIKARKDILNVGGNPIGIIINMVKIKKDFGLIIKIKFNQIKEKIKEIFVKRRKLQLPEARKGVEYLNPDIELAVETVLEPEKVEEISETKTEEIPVAQTETIDIEAAAEKEINVEPIIVDDTFEETIEESVKEETEEINSEEPKHEKIKKPLKESIIETFSKLKNKFIKNKRVKEESIEESNTENKLSEWEDPVEYKYEITDYKTFEKEENKEEYVPKHSETNIDGQISLLENEKESISDASVITTETAKESPTVEKQEETNNLTINEQTPTLKDESEENIEFNQMPLEKYLSDENTILIVVDAENAYCRLFGANAFIEKPIYTISSDSNGNKSYYNRRYIRKIQNRIRNTYGITDEQIKRIDVLIYSILREYDDALWTDKRIESHTAESYVQIMSKDYDRIIGESDMEYLIRSKRVRILTLAKSNIDIEYLTDNIWKFNKLKIKDKFVISKYVKQFEIEDYLKSDFEKQKTKQNIEFYNNIYKATNEFRKHEPKHEQESIKEENQVKEENAEINELDKEEQKLIKKFKKEKARIDRIEKRKERLEIAREKRNKKKAERIKSQQLLKEQREFEKERQREEARIEEELLTDNLYPKTKFNKNL